jgi:hypothetical protein
MILGIERQEGGAREGGREGGRKITDHDFSEQYSVLTLLNSHHPIYLAILTW